MYQPPHFREDRLEVQHALIRSQPLGLLVTAGPGGLQANHIPFLIEADGSPHGKLRAHLARANPQLAELAAVDECLVAFQGPQTYGKVVPTWNYITVHAWGRPRVIDDVAWIRHQVDDLTSHNERSRETPWLVSDAPEGFLAAQLKAIVGVEIPIARIEGKWKVSQNRPAVDRAGVVAGLRGGGGDTEIIAAKVAERGKRTP